MDTSKILPGKELVSRGVTKINATLPDPGQKEITPNGTWLENKQVQSALDARRHLLEVERIEKLGSLSIAVWRDELKLAEVIKKAGSHWQYIGHNIGKHLYLQPEETLYLMEINSLLLKHNEVIVSLQKAYTLCLTDVGIAQYKVYASLSRLGYRVFRHGDNITQKNQEITLNVTHECVNDNNEEQSKSGNLNVIKNAESNENSLIPPSNKPSSLNNTSSTEMSQNMKNTCIASNNVVGQSNSSKETRLDKRNAHCVDKNKAIVILTENSEQSESLKNVSNDKVLKCSEIHQNSGKEIMPCKDNDRGVIILGNNSKNIENNSEGMDVDVDTNNTDQILNAVNIDSDTTPAVDTTDGAGENGRKNQSTVIVNTRNIENVATGESNNSKITSIVPENKDKIANIATVIVNTKNVTNSYTKNKIVARENRKNALDNGSSELNYNCPDVIYSVDVSGVVRMCDHSDPMEMEHGTDQQCCKGESATSIDQNSGIDNLDLYLMHKMQKLQNRQTQINRTQKNSDSETILLPDCYDKKVVTAKSPHVEYLPRNIFLMKTTYLLDLEGIKRTNSKNRKDSTTESSDRDCNEPRRLSVTGPVGRNNNPRLHEIQSRPRLVLINPPMYPMFPAYYSPPVWCPRPPLPLYRHYMRPRYHTNRPIIPNVDYSRPRYNDSNARKRGNPRFKSYHLRVIKKLVDKFKLVYAPNHVNDLVRLVNTFNEQYDEKYQLTEDFKLVDVNEIQEVIDLEEGEPTAKKPRPNDENEKINKHLETLKSLAVKLKDLEAKKLATSRHRRVLSNAIKMFNKNFNADIYLNSGFEIIDSKLITLDSSSDSDSVVAVEPTKRKRLRNPFSIMKHRNKINEGASTSSGVPVLQQQSLNSINHGFNRDEGVVISKSPTPENGGVGLMKYFHNAWVPSEDDFGRPEVKSREEAYFFDLLEAEYQHTYYKYHTRCFENWLDLKVAIMAQAQERIKARKERAILNNVVINDQIQPLVGPDCMDTGAMLEKLQIIPSTMAVGYDSSYSSGDVDFDVYYGNSPHFRKASRPKPNFRVLCVDVSEQAHSVQWWPAPREVPLMFGAVGTGSISYIQLTHIDTPIYIPDSLY